MTSVWYVNSSNTIRLESLIDQDGAPVTTATVELTALVDCDGNTPDGLTLPLELAHDSGGNYEATLDEDVDVEVGDVLTATIVATAGGAVREWKETLVVRQSKG